MWVNETHASSFFWQLSRWKKWMLCWAQEELDYRHTSSLPPSLTQSACHGWTKPDCHSLFSLAFSVLHYNLHEKSVWPWKSVCAIAPPPPHPTALIAAGVIIRSHIHVKKVLKLPLKGLKCGPVLFILLPAVYHYVVQDFRAVGGTWHPVAQRDLLDHLQVCHGYNNHSTQLSTFINRHVVAFWIHVQEDRKRLTWVWHLSERHDLIK